MVRSLWEPGSLHTALCHFCWILSQTHSIPSYPAIFHPSFTIFLPVLWPLPFLLCLSSFLPLFCYFSFFFFWLKKWSSVGKGVGIWLFVHQGGKIVQQILMSAVQSLIQKVIYNNWSYWLAHGNYFTFPSVHIIWCLWIWNHFSPNNNSYSLPFAHTYDNSVLENYA